MGILYGGSRVGLGRLFHWLVYRGKVGPGFRIGRGSFVIASDLKIGRDVRVGSRSKIIADRLEIGDKCLIGDQVNMNAKSISLGGETRVDDRVIVVGSPDPQSVLRVGRSTWIWNDCLLNPHKELEIGDNVCVGMGCRMWTHGYWQPEIDGYPVTNKPIRVGNDVWLQANVTVNPGMDVGDGATVISGTVVRKNVPARSLAAGNPMTIVLDGSRYPRRLQPEARVSLVRSYLHRLCEELASGFQFDDIVHDRRFVPVRVSEDEIHVMLRDHETCVHLQHGQETATTPSCAAAPTVQHIALLMGRDRPASIPGGYFATIDLDRKTCQAADPLDPTLRKVTSLLRRVGVHLWTTKTPAATSS